MSPARTAPLVAREQTLQELWLQVAASAAQGMRAAVVRGPAGSGKTRVLDAFAERARGAGASVLAGRSPALGGHAYAALADALGAYVRSSAPAAGQIRRAGDALVALVPALAAADDGPADRRILPDAMAVVQAAYRLVRLITERRPLVLILDDGHLADADTCEALAALQRHAADLPWTLIVGWREPAEEVRESATRLVELLRRERDAVEVALEPLGVAAVGELVAALLGDGLPSPTLVEAMHRRSAGNPYYIEEMVRWLRDSGRLRRVGLQWMAAEDSEEELPPTLEAALRQRSRALPENARTVLEWLAVAGGPVDLGLLSDVSGLDPSRLATALDTLVRAGLIAEQGGRRPDYRVHHPLVGECVYRDLSLAHRRLSHQTLARALALRGEPPGAVAAHHVRAADPGDAEALAATLAAAADAESRHHFSQAVSWYAEVVRLAENDDVARLGALDRLSELGAYAGRADLALEAVDELLALTPATDAQRVTLLRRLATLRVISGEIDRGRAAIEEGLSLAAGSGTEVAMLLAELTMVAQMTLPVAEILELIARGRAVALKTGAVSTDLVFRAFEAIAVTDSGDPRRGLELAMDAAHDAMEAQEFLGFGYNAFAAGIAELVLGRFEHLEQNVGSFVETAEAAGLVWGAAWMWHLLGSSQFYRGDFDGALASFLRSEEMARRHGTAMVMPLPVLMCANVLAAQGRLAEARDRLEEARRWIEQRPARFMDGWYWAAAGMVADAGSRFDEAVVSYQNMADAFERRGDHAQVALKPLLVHALISAGRPGEALALARQIEASIAERDIPFARATSAGALADALSATGNHAEAIAVARRAVELVSAVDGAFLRGRIEAVYGLALHRAGRRGEARDVLARAHARLAAIPVVHERDRVRAALGELGVPVATGERRATGAPAAAERDSLDPLSRREREVAELAATGLSSRSVALRLALSERTIENHLQRIYAKLGLHSRAELIALVAGTADVAVR
ncbi:MAG TPA: AAA family ATPase [Candidatus Dormibacteraeota bacterium]|nr:AAA family ATPase [Candidatus Dormibacteraeota bacterium]